MSGDTIDQITMPRNCTSQITMPRDCTSQITMPRDCTSQITMLKDCTSQITMLKDCTSQITMPRDCTSQITMPRDCTSQITMSRDPPVKSASRVALVESECADIGGNSVPFNMSVKYLGVHLDQIVSMRQHIDSVCRASFLELR